MYAWGKKRKLLVFTAVYVCVKAKLTLVWFFFFNFFCTFPLTYYLMKHLFSLANIYRVPFLKQAHALKKFFKTWSNQCVYWISERVTALGAFARPENVFPYSSAHRHSPPQFWLFKDLSWWSPVLVNLIFCFYYQSIIMHISQHTGNNTDKLWHWFRFLSFGFIRSKSEKLSQH